VAHTLDLLFEVRVNVNETRGKDKASCVNSLGGWDLVKRPNSVNPTVADANICLVRRISRPINHAGVLDHHVERALACFDALRKMEDDNGAQDEEQFPDVKASTHDAPPWIPCNLAFGYAVGQDT
jgi:hypothetical protein